ncbi:MAG TPA: hypothetical protein VKY19_16020 [Ktedonosporobacter sp.]|nr:hypothetical protein [Ktedonosporobacter sp.]
MGRDSRATARDCPYPSICRLGQDVAGQAPGMAQHRANPVGVSAKMGRGNALRLPCWVNRVGTTLRTIII